MRAMLKGKGRGGQKVAAPISSFSNRAFDYRARQRLERRSTFERRGRRLDPRLQPRRNATGRRRDEFDPQPGRNGVDPGQKTPGRAFRTRPVFVRPVSTDIVGLHRKFPAVHLTDVARNIPYERLPATWPGKGGWMLSGSERCGRRHPRHRQTCPKNPETQACRWRHGDCAAFIHASSCSKHYRPARI